MTSVFFSPLTVTNTSKSTSARKLSGFFFCVGTSAQTALNEDLQPGSFHGQRTLKQCAATTACMHVSQISCVTASADSQTSAPGCSVSGSAGSTFCPRDLAARRRSSLDDLLGDITTVPAVVRAIMSSCRERSRDRRRGRDADLLGP